MVPYSPGGGIQDLCVVHSLHSPGRLESDEINTSEMLSRPFVSGNGTYEYTLCSDAMHALWVVVYFCKYVITVMLRIECGVSYRRFFGSLLGFFVAEIFGDVRSFKALVCFN